MLEKLLNSVAPVVIDRELASLDGEIARLRGEREEHRLTAGRLVTASADPSDLRDASQHFSRMSEIDGELAPLVSRRRKIAREMAPKPEVHSAIISVPMPADAIAAGLQLDQARERRRALIAAAIDETDAKAIQKRAALLRDAEEEIHQLRMRRAELLIPYNLALTEAASPLIRKAALQLKDAAAAFLVALKELGEISSVLPPPMPGLSNGLDRAATIDSRPCHFALDFADTLLAANHDSEGEAK